MKKIFAALICIMLVFTLAACGKKTSQQTGSSTDNVATETETQEATADEGTPAAAEGPWVLTESHVNSYLYTEFIYDENGQVVKEVWYNSEYGTTGTDNYTYMQQDDGTTLVRRMAEGEAIHGDEFLYDANGMCIESIYYSALTSDPEKMFTEDHIESRTNYEYDDSGRLLVSTTVRENGSKTAIEYDYDDNGRVVSVEEKNLDTGTVNVSHQYVYDGDDFVQENYTSVSFGENLYDCTSEYEYGDNGLLSTKKIIYVDTGGAKLTINYGYSEDNVLTDITFSSGFGFVYGEYFLGEGYLMEDNTACKVVFKPLSLALEQQTVE